jgi:hypothetical protein
MTCTPEMHLLSSLGSLSGEETDIKRSRFQIEQIIGN